MNLPLATLTPPPHRTWIRATLIVCPAVCLAAIMIIPGTFAPYDPFDPAAIDLSNAGLPPALFFGGRPGFPLGTDEQGRDLLSLLVFGTRTSLMIATIATLIAAIVGTLLGLTAAITGHLVDSGIRRLAEIQLTFPAIIVALILQAILTAAHVAPGGSVIPATLVIAAIAVAGWPEFALGVRAVARAQLPRDYIAAAVSIGRSPTGIVRHHLWPAARGQVVVLSLWTAARAITIEATLSFLGSGLPPQTPSLGRLIRDGHAGLLVGKWWQAGPALVVVTALILFLGAAAELLRRATEPGD